MRQHGRGSLGKAVWAKKQGNAFSAVVNEAYDAWNNSVSLAECLVQSDIGTLQALASSISWALLEP